MVTDPLSVFTELRLDDQAPTLPGQLAEHGAAGFDAAPLASRADVAAWAGAFFYAPTTVVENVTGPAGDITAHLPQTQGAGAVLPPRLAALVCPTGSMVPLLVGLVDGAAVVRDLVREAPEALEALRVEGARVPRASGEVDTLPVVFGLAPGRVGLRLAADGRASFGEGLGRCLAVLHKVARRRRVCVEVPGGSALVVDNHRMLVGQLGAPRRFFRVLGEPLPGAALPAGIAFGPQVRERSQRSEWPVWMPVERATVRACGADFDVVRLTGPAAPLVIRRVEELTDGAGPGPVIRPDAAGVALHVLVECGATARWRPSPAAVALPSGTPVSVPPPQRTSGRNASWLAVPRAPLTALEVLRRAVDDVHRTLRSPARPGTGALRGARRGAK